ncbi:hypothetical protein [Flavobacterium cerinum]|uniref:Uncharacterized protein n=1 Tax=Flavobacterium cerinum TaxID=2502784 RepID=A0ABY5IWG5_9FLAO|nr:hypothetical protein [Flavobacterium cerinum]UUC47155.1 hypothetical protein NOX80_08140 [Flavobacterium cerinum]
MKLLPYGKITYRTKLTEAEVVHNLSEQVRIWGIDRSGNSEANASKRYEGSIGKQSFDIKRVITYRNSFRPAITGIIDKESKGTIIQVKIGGQGILWVLILWLAGMLFAGITTTLFETYDNKADFQAVIALLIMMFLFVYGMVMMSFVSEWELSKDNLKKIFEAEIIN